MTELSSAYFVSASLKPMSSFEATLTFRPSPTQLQQTAQVIFCDAETIHLTLATQAKGCQQCHQQTGCGAALIARLWPRRDYPLIIPRQQIQQPVQVGDTLVVRTESANIQGAMLTLYAYPLLGLMLGTVFGAGLGDAPLLTLGTELPSIIGGLLGFSVGLVWAKRSARSVSGTHHVHIAPEIVTAPRNRTQ